MEGRRKRRRRGKGKKCNVQVDTVDDTIIMSYGRRGRRREERWERGRRSDM